jgi:L-fucose isomerase-like protein
MSFTFGLIVGNRDFFPDELARIGREEMIKILQKENFSVICPSPEDTRFGVVETWEDAKKCAALFKENQEKIDGIIVSLPNFGDEKAVSNTIRLSGFGVPVLVHASPDDLDALDVPHRRDSFCGKISVCHNLNQYGIPFSLTRLHTISPQDKSFKEDLHWFTGVCRLVKGLKNIKLGAIGARPGAFNTVRFSEKILESLGISVETIGLSDIYAGMSKISDDDGALRAKIEEIKSYCDTKGVPPEKISTIARFGIVVER